MPNGKKSHIDITDRKVIEDGLRDRLSAREIARRIDVSPSTVTREVRTNRDVKYPKGKRIDIRRRCAGFEDCQYGGEVCDKCVSRLTTCKRCKLRRCIDHCKDFVLRTCAMTDTWPYVCKSGCQKRYGCHLPKFSYSASSAQEKHDERLVGSRRGIDMDIHQIEKIMAIVDPLVRKGQSFDAIWQAHADEIPICVRTMYNYVERGDVGIAPIRLPRKVRCKPRKKKANGTGPARSRIDRTGRTHDDFLLLSEEERARVVQGDSVLGYEHNSQCILSLHFRRLDFQMYFLEPDAQSSSVVAELDRIERILGAPSVFEQALGILLVDRGGEFDDFLGMERSCLEEDARRCRVFYCDAMNSNQKSECERNHAELRRILPKERSDFDVLECRDVAIACSHVNSYPRPALYGARPYDLAALALPGELLDAYGIVRIEPDEVVMSPALLPHVVKQ